MLLRLIAVGTRMPRWVDEGYEEYAARLTADYRLELKEVALGQRSGGNVGQAMAKEGERMLAALPSRAHIVALQVTGKSMTSEQLARFLEHAPATGAMSLF